MKHRFNAATAALIAMVMVVPTAAFADRDDKKQQGNNKRYEKKVDPRRSSDRRGTSDLSHGRADGEVFRIKRSNGGTGRAPIINRNAPVYKKDNGNHNGWYKKDNGNHNGWNIQDNRQDNRWQSPRQESQRRQQTKNEWRNIAIGSGLVSLFGLLKNDSRITFAGAAGTLYAAYRYEEDRKSQNRVDRARADLFGRDHFVRDGRRYDRKTVYKGGQKYYQFVCNR